MKIIGITGNSGSGKSIVCEIIKENFNAEIIDNCVRYKVSARNNKNFWK